MSNSDSTDRRQQWFVLGMGLAFAVLTLVIRPLSTFGYIKYNLVPIGGLALYFGARQSRLAAYLVPLATMILTDLCLFVFSGQNTDFSLLHISRPFVYAAIVGYVVIGRWARKTRYAALIGSSALLGSLQFYIITNFQSWVELSNPALATPTYSRDLTGLLNSYVAGIPFFGPTIASDLAFTAFFFGVHALAVRFLQENTTSDPALVNDASL